MNINLWKAREIAYDIKAKEITVSNYYDHADEVMAAFHKLDQSKAIASRRDGDRRLAKLIWDFVGTVSRAGNHVGAMPAVNSYA